jgi:glycosyltransferase involved in cell wall biosynthesis
VNRPQATPIGAVDEPRSEALRRQIETRGRAEALVRDELARREPLRAEVTELESRAGIGRRAVAALAGSRLAGLLAGDRSLTAGAEPGVAREAAELRRRRFRLSRRKRTLEGGATRPLRAALARVRPARTSADDENAALLRRRSRAGARAPAFCIRIAARDWEAANSGGDAALARSLARALGERGHQAMLQIDSEAGDPTAESLDVLLVLRGRPTGEPTRGRINLLWQISHPEETDAAELDRYDRVLVASTRHAEELRGTVRPPVEPLLQFTDPEFFHPVAGLEPMHDLAFVGNWRGEFRRIVWDALQARRPPALYGRGWDLLAPEHAVAEHVPHTELSRLYSSCKILLCDHWEDMRRHGFVSNKVFDALACGTFVIADDNPGLAEVLPGGVETYSSAAELGAKIDRYLAHPEERERIARRGREIVLAEHTAERRAEQLLAIAAATVRECDRPDLDRLRERDRWNGARAVDASAMAAAPRAAREGRA